MPRRTRCGRSSRVTRWAALAAAACAALGLCACGGNQPERAHAAPRELTILDASNEATGFYGEAARRDSIRELDDLGVDVLRVILYWRDIVPAPNSARAPKHFNPRDPAGYNRSLGAVDQTVREAADHGIDVLLVPTGRFPDGRIPRWAQRHPRGKSHAPSARKYGALIEALGRRYGGGFDPDGKAGRLAPIPRVRYMSIWNEPNSGAFLQPVARGPEIYRRLVLAGARGAKRARWDGTLLAGEASAGGSNQTPPVEFMRRVLCMPPGFAGPPGCRQLPVDGWSQHPYSIGLDPWQQPPDPGSVSIGSLGRLTGPLSAATAAGALPPGTRLWLTEYGYESYPDPKGVSLATQAEYDSVAERLAYENPLVASFAQYLLHDDPSVHGTYHAFETGLRFHSSGEADCERRPRGCKPAWFAFRTPLAVRIAGDQAQVWGRIRPARRPVPVQVAYLDPDGSQGIAGSVRTDATGYFSFTAPAVPGRTWSVRSGRFQGPWVRGYAY
jgi:hypothetical protein